MGVDTASNINYRRGLLLVKRDEIQKQLNEVVTLLNMLILDCAKIGHPGQRYSQYGMSFINHCDACGHSWGD